MRVIASESIHRSRGLKDLIEALAASLLRLYHQAISEHLSVSFTHIMLMKLDKFRYAALERRLNVLQDDHGSYLAVWVPMDIVLKSEPMRTGPPEIDMTALESETATSSTTMAKGPT